MIPTTLKAATFSADYWIIGAAGFTDAGDPNAFPPAANRIMRLPARILAADLGGLGTSTPSMRCFLADGTNATLRAWFFDDAQNMWLPIGSAAVTAIYATINRLAYLVRCMPGVKLFLQISTNVGVSKIAIFFA
jgi:hypothetical protein